LKWSEATLLQMCREIYKGTGAIATSSISRSTLSEKGEERNEKNQNIMIMVEFIRLDFNERQIARLTCVGIPTITSAVSSRGWEAWNSLSA
jgi:hypothetical protein